MTADKKIGHFLKAIKKLQDGVDFSTIWPANPLQIEPYYTDIFAVNLFKKFKADPERFSKALKTLRVDLVRHLLYSGGGQIGLKVAKKYGSFSLSSEEIEDLTLCLIESIEERVFSDPFCLDGKNLLLSSKEVEKKFTGASIINLPNYEDRRGIAFLNLAGESLTWALFFDAYRAGGLTVHGPYPTRRGNLLIRDHYDLRPEFFRAEDCPRRLEIGLFYSPKLKLEINFGNQLYFNQRHLDYLEAAFVRVDGDNPKTLNEVDMIEERLESVRKRRSEAVERMSPEGIIAEGAKIYFYLYREFFSSYKESWSPPPDVQKRIGDWRLTYWKKYCTSKDYPTSDFVDSADPRKELN